MSKKPVLLCIMDGYGMPEIDEGNAIAAAKKPNLDKLFAEYKLLHDYFGRGGNDVMMRLRDIASAAN